MPRAAPLLALALLTACASGGGTRGTGRGRDTGPGGGPDGGEPGSDGAIPGDGGPGDPDGFVPPVDAFVPPVDSGPACARVTCDPRATCMEVGGVGTCTCNPGYAGDGTTCSDVDECAMGAAGCAPAADCTNTDGSATCTCRTGFTGDGRTCTDVDECALGTDTCHANATCSNTSGAFSCACNAGFTGDGFTCTPVGPTCTPVESFERGWPAGDVTWTAVGGASGTRSAGGAHDGAFGLTDPDWHYETAATAGAGSRIRAWVRSRGTGRIYVGFDASAAGCKSFVVAPNTGDIRFQDNAGWAYTELTTAATTIASGTWYRIEIEFAGGGAMVGRLYGSDGTSLVSTVAHTYGGVGTGGLALRSFGTYDVDTLEICR